MYHIDLDNALHCNFFNETHRALLTRNDTEVITFPIWYSAEGDVLEPLPKPGNIDTANFFHLNGIVSKASLTWGVAVDFGSKYTFPDAALIIPAVLFAEERHTYMKIPSVLGYHNRLKWTSIHGKDTCPSL